MRNMNLTRDSLKLYNWFDPLCKIIETEQEKPNWEENLNIVMMEGKTLKELIAIRDNFLEVSKRILSHT